MPDHGEFEIDNVRNGTYWPVAFLDIDRNGRINGEDRVASYDDHDSITVEGEDVENVNIDMYIGGNAEAPEQPGIARLGEIHPNPSIGAAQVELALATSATVHLGVFNLLGQEVRTMMNAEFLPFGSHQIRWDVSSLAAGAYICRLQVDAGTQSRLFFVTK